MLLRTLKKTLLHSPLSRDPSSTYVLLILRYSSSTSPIQNPDDPKPHFMNDYLITSCGFPPDSASRVAKRLVRSLQSPQNPDYVIQSLKHHGFVDADVRRLISRHPPLLSSNVQKSIEPNVRILRGMGFSGPDLPRVVLRNPSCLDIPNMGPRIEFWRTLLGNDERKLRRAFERNRNLMGLDAAKRVTPKIALFKSYGLSNLQIQRILLLGSIFINSMDSIKALLNRALDLGIPSDSSVFVYALYTLAHTGREGLQAKMELLNKYGWTEQDFLSAFRKTPNFAALSEKTIQSKMEFLVGRAGCTASYVALHPFILTYSLEKRLMPRNHALQILKAKEGGSLDFSYVVHLNEKMFLEKFIPRYKEQVPNLREMYIAACAGRVSL